MARNSGMSATPGALTGVSRASSVSARARTILPLSRAVLGPLPRTPGLIRCGIKQPRKSKTTLRMTRLYTRCLRNNTIPKQVAMCLRLSFLDGRAAVSARPPSLTVRSSTHPTAGSFSELRTSLSRSTGETRMTPIIFLGIRTSTSLSTVAPAGPKALHQPLPIDSIS